MGALGASASLGKTVSDVMGTGRGHWRVPLRGSISLESEARDLRDSHGSESLTPMSASLMSESYWFCGAVLEGGAIGSLLLGTEDPGGGKRLGA